MKVAVTGASGFLGSRVVQALEREGHAPILLSRRTPAEGHSHLTFDLADKIPASEDFKGLGVEALIHCAWDLRARRTEDIRRINIEGSERLFAAARAGGVDRILNISTMSAYTGCRSRYGQSKLIVERVAAKYGGTTLRPGLIWADRPGGIVGTLDGMAERLPLVPMIGSGRSALYLAHIDDLVGLIALCVVADQQRVPAVITAASPDPVPLRDILRTRAAARGRSPLLVPVPWQMIWLIVRALELLPLEIDLRSDSVVGFIFSDPSPRFDAAALSAIGFAGFRPFLTAPRKTKSCGE